MQKYCCTLPAACSSLLGTKKTLTEKLLSSMLPNAVFINTARGAQVDDEGLIKALGEEPGKLALIDVADPEPLEKNHPFLKLPNIRITPHISGTYEESIPLIFPDFPLL